MEILGIDIGGSGIKGAPVNTDHGSFLADRIRIPTPRSAKPTPVVKIVAEITRYFNWHGPIGCGFPAPIRGGIALSAANVHQKWIGTSAESLFTEATGCQTTVMNDADAAGLAEVTFGAGMGVKGVVLVVTVGTGLGTALFTNGCLLPNTEFGHLEMNGQDAETQASDAARKQEKLSWKEWSERLDEYLHLLERLIWPDLIILGGGAAKNQERFIPRLCIHTKIVPAQMLNDAGIIGAALFAGSRLKTGESV
jgi:polyphosphate glucokinase